MIAALAFAVTLAPLKVLDSQLVLQRYEARLTATKDPQTLIFLYSVSQAGPLDIDQMHRVYRSGSLVRDETLVVDGVKQKTTRIARYRNRYTLHNLAPRTTRYVFLFVRPIVRNGRYDYLYRAVPLGAPAAFTVRTMTIDGRTFLPREIRFHSTGAGARGDGTLAFTAAGKYWVPLSIAVQGSVNGRTARERITFGGYQFPAALPQSTFHAPRALPPAVLPTF
ncbi:MAG TPA: hypothetical protein VFW34_01950 [Candidatus Rubrimentiphilum sp.]|nr:hypothetical protein [Candidatus Rubrimentiphilum sp.]